MILSYTVSYYIIQYYTVLYYTILNGIKLALLHQMLDSADSSSAASSSPPSSHVQASLQHAALWEHVQCLRTQLLRQPGLYVELRRLPRHHKSRGFQPSPPPGIVQCLRTQARATTLPANSLKGSGGQVRLTTEQSEICHHFSAPSSCQQQ